MQVHLQYYLIEPGVELHISGVIMIECKGPGMDMDAIGRRGVIKTIDTGDINR